MRDFHVARPQKREQLPAGVSSVAVSAAPPLTKGSQDANGYSVQDLKDAGRTVLAITLEATAAGAAEALATMTVSVSGAATSTFSSRSITSAKRLRLQLVMLEVEALGTGTAPQRAYLRLRSEPSGATTTSSPLQMIIAAATNDAIVKASAQSKVDIPDGFELSGASRTFGFTLECPDYVATTGEVRVKATILAFEY